MLLLYSEYAYTIREGIVFSTITTGMHFNFSNWLLTVIDVEYDCN